MTMIRWFSALAPLWLVLGAMAVVAEPGADAACLMCHKAVAEGGISHSAHGLGPDPSGMSPAVTCTACHGPSGAHSASPRTPPDFTFTRAEGNGGDATCLACHQQGAMAHWAFGEHAAAGVSCASCHAIHTATDPVRERGGQFGVCTDCHQREKMDQLKFSRHPMAEGHVQCSDCHAPHGGSALNGLTQPTINDSCYQCHADKRGPFLFEHEPVQDDCTHCHLPHGSVNDNLLKAREPFLCQQCHIASRHPGTLYDSARQAQRDINIIGQSCTNCHSQVHGGNHPASSTFRR